MADSNVWLLNNCSQPHFCFLAFHSEGWKDPHCLSQLPSQLRMPMSDSFEQGDGRGRLLESFLEALLLRDENRRVSKERFLAILACPEKQSHEEVMEEVTEATLPPQGRVQENIRHQSPTHSWRSWWNDSGRAAPDLLVNKNQWASTLCLLVV